MLDRIMTGKEKIQVVIDEVDVAYQNLIRGNIVSLQSDDLERKGLSLDDQKQVFELLSDNQHVRYTFRRRYKSKADLDENTRHLAMIVAEEKGITYADRVQQVLGSGTYTVEVLENFVRAEITQDKTPKTTEYVPATPIPKVELHKFQPQHYKERVGVLQVSEGVSVSIAKKGRVKRKNGQKYDQCWLLECLFKNVNSLKSGITFSKFLGVKAEKISKKDIRKIRNTVYEINSKVSGVGGPNNLIKIQKQEIYLNNSYL